jgi:hypothetical protein
MREADVRSAIAARLSSNTVSTALMVSEMVVCQAEARIDLAVIEPNRLVGWEIKTGVDKLTRLPLQQEIYSRVFDRVWLVAEQKHLCEATNMVPAWWGVVRVDDRPTGCRLTQVRPSRVNRQIDMDSVVRLLWRDEALAELRLLGLDAGLGRAPKRQLWDALAAAVPRRISATELRKRVRVRLMSRIDWRAGAPRK